MVDRQRVPLGFVVAGGLLSVLALGAGRLGLLEGGFGPVQFLALALGLAPVVAWLMPAAPLGLGRGLLLGLWYGLLVGVTEALHLAVRKLGFGVILKLPPEFVWMTPLANALLGVAYGLVLGVLGRGANQAALAFAGGMLLAYAHCQIYTLSKVATLVLCLGAGLQLARMAASAGGVPRAVRWSLPAMLLLVVAVGIVVPAVVRVSSAPAATSAAPKSAPNVLFVVLDTVRADRFGSYGYDRATTPGMDALGQAGVLFERAVSTSPWTLTGHVTLFTGEYPHRTSADWHAVLDGEHPTLAEAFALHGYATGGFVGNLRYCAAEFGIDRGFERYEDFAVRPETVVFSASTGYAVLNQLVGQPFHAVIRNDATTMTDRVLAWQQDVGERPWFAFVNYYDTHAYCDAPPPFAGKFGPGGGDMRDWNARDARKEAERMQGFANAYDACLAYVDHEIDRLLAELEQCGVLQNTVVVITADHGEQFGEHGLTGHGNSLYQPNLHVPLLVAGPGVPTGVRVPGFVSLCDVPRTLLGLAGVPADGWPGHDLAPLWRGVPDAPLSPVLAEVTQVEDSPPHIPVGRGDMESLTQDGKHLIVNGDGVLELYDLRADPAEEHDLTQRPDGKAEAEALQRVLEELRRP